MLIKINNKPKNILRQRLRQKKQLPTINKTAHLTPVFKIYFLLPSVLFTAVLLILLFPSTGFCWGPVSHIDLATEVLNLSKLLVPQVAELIRNYPYDYFYGNIGADIVIGKNFTEYEYHCHNWVIAGQIFKLAHNNHQKAFAYGYISHLASDVLAHNYFVPNMIITMYRKRMFLHPYWEMRFDKLVNKNIVATIEKTFKLRHIDDNDLLKYTLEKTLFSFSTNKNLFNGMMLMNRKKFLRDIFNGLTSNRKWHFSEQEFNMYKTHSIDAIIDVLNNGNKSLYTKIDPTGSETIHIAYEIRKQLNKLHKQGKLSDKDIKDLTNTILPNLPPGIYSNQKILKNK